MICPTGKGDFSRLLVILMKAAGRMVRHMGMGDIPLKMAKSTWVTGRMTYNMAKGEKSGRTGHGTKDSLKMARNTGLALISTPTVPVTRVKSSKIYTTAKVGLDGLMESNT